MLSGSVDLPLRDAASPTARTRSAKERFFLGGKVCGVAMFLRHPRPATCSRSEVFIRELLLIWDRMLTVAGLSCKFDKHVCLFITFGRRIPSLGKHILNLLGPHVEVRPFK